MLPSMQPILPVPRPSLCVRVALHVCNCHHEDLITRNKHARLVRCREVAVRLIRKRTLCSMPETAVAISRTHSSTIVAIERRVRKLLDAEDQEFIATFNAAERLLDEVLRSGERE